MKWDHILGKMSRVAREHFLLECAIASFFALLLVGCDQSVSDDPDDGEVATIEVLYNDTIVSVDLATTEAVILDDGESYSRFSDIVEGADLGVALETLEFDFEGADGYRPSTRSTCVDHIPATWEMIQGGYVHRAYRNMEWDAEMEMPRCSHVDEMIRIRALDAGTLRRTVEVEYEGDTVVVDLRNLDRVDFDGSDHVRLSDVVAYAALGIPLASLEFNFVASDGFRPSDSGNCVDFVPVPGPLLEEGYVSFEGVNLVWDASTGLPGCLNVDDVVRIEATNSEITGPTVEVLYHDETIVVDLDDAEVVQHEGSNHVRVSDIVGLAALGADIAGLLFNFESSDGFMPNHSYNCVDFFPIDSDRIGVGYLELSSRNLVWSVVAILPRCAFVDDIVRIHVTDDSGATEGPYIDVIHGETTETIDLSEIETVTFLGTSHVRLVDVVEAAELSIVISDLVFDFIASDGYRSTGVSTCVGIAPVPGAQLVDAYIDLETSNLVWTEESEMHGCVWVDDLAQIEALDP